MSNKFMFFVPAEIEKGQKDGSGNVIMKVRGVASTPDKDTDEETLEPDGFIIDKLVKSGFINWNHRSKDDPSAIIGEPTSAKIKDNQLVLEGVLYPTSEKAIEAYKLMETLEKSGSTRRIGWSIEGKAMERDPLNSKRITKALITGVALTPMPKNAATYASLMKGETDDLNVDELEFDIEKSANGGEQYIIDVTNPETEMRYIVKKDFSVVVEKAMSTASSAAVMPEDLEGAVKKLPEERKRAVVTLAKAYEAGLIDESVKEKVINIIKGV